MSDVAKYTETRAQGVVDDYLEAYKSCRQTLFYCEQKGGAYADPVLLRELHDASQICLLCANFLMRGSRHHRSLMQLGCQVLQACADAIEGIDVEDDQLEVAYVATLRAKQACLDMIQPEHSRDQAKQDEALQDTFPASDPATPTPK